MSELSSSTSLHELLKNKFSKTNGQTGESQISEETSIESIFEENFKFNRILSVNSNLKQICLECTFNGKPAILILEKNQFEEVESIGNNFGNLLKNVKNLFHNDIYGSYHINLSFGNMDDDLFLNKIFLTVIHPASPKDIEKYLDHSISLIRETPEHYEKITKPFILEQVSIPGHLQWVYNILEGKAEVDRVIHSNEQFILVKDMKWKCDQPDDQLTEMDRINVYLNAIVVRRDIHSLRDITDEHLPLLEYIYNDGRQIISEKYSIPIKELRVFIHYQPSFYHFHVHFNHIKNSKPGFQCERAHPLSNVIENIRLMPNYYQKVTLEFPLSDISPLKF